MDDKNNLTRFEAAKILKEKERAISDIQHFSDFSTFQRPQDKCIGQYTEEYVSYDEWRYKDEITTTQYCPEFEKKYGCFKTDCPNYQKYREYRKAKNDYDRVNRESLGYPLRELFGWLFGKEK